MNVTLQGHLYAIGEIQEITLKNGSLFYKREAIINFSEGDDGQFIQHIGIEFMGEDKVKVLNHFKKNDAIIARCDLRGRLWQKNADTPERAFNSLLCWKLENANGEDAVNNDIKKLPLPSEQDADDDGSLPF